MSFEEHALEEELQYSNVTGLRKSLLGVIKRLQKKPALRYLITKHGRPQAVLMSFQTYELLKKVMNQTLEQLEQAAGKSRKGAVRAAFARLRAERLPALGVAGAAEAPKVVRLLDVAALHVRVQALDQDVSRLHDLLEMNEEQAPSATLTK